MCQYNLDPNVIDTAIVEISTSDGASESLTLEELGENRGVFAGNLPDEFSGTYEAKGVYNTMVNKFEVVDENTTRWWAESDFKFSGFMSIMSIFMGGAMRKQTETFMTRFKDFVESSE